MRKKKRKTKTSGQDEITSQIYKDGDGGAWWKKDWQRNGRRSFLPSNITSPLSLYIWHFSFFNFYLLIYFSNHRGPPE